MLNSSEGVVESNDKDESGLSLLTVKDLDNKSILITCSSLQQCSLILQVAKEKCLTETRFCLERKLKNIKIRTNN
jgi:hypothetical protein